MLESDLTPERGNFFKQFLLTASVNQGLKLIFLPLSQSHPPIDLQPCQGTVGSA
ncbi:hypothetical protein Lysil_2340 [Lysobacter silvestris]|uniref:Uncharacterized protein n=1 Tax=Solilutibacter silvestris TaxID=1645665 RepID=A0A2K1PZE9_9GAMM|nr:hypothetical protein Lysil_2340 [Lysobacter silvestris]